MAKPKKDEWTWSDAERPGIEWLADVPGEKIPARIKISSRNSDGSYSYFCFRGASAVAIVHTLEDAKRKCVLGKQPKMSDSVLKYVDEHPGEIPPFLLLTDGERRAVRAQYPYAAPPATRVKARLERQSGGPEDPGTTRLRRELAASGTSPAGGRRAAVPKKVRGEAAPSPQGVLARVRDTNPKKEGTGAWKRWEALFAACVDGKSVEAFQASGGNMETLANAVRAGYVAIREGKR